MDLNWKDLIKREYETLKVEKDKSLTDLWNENMASVWKENDEKKSPCSIWSVHKGQHLKRGKEVSVTFLGKATKRKSITQSYIFPYISPPPSMPNWTPVPRNFVTEDCRQLQCLPYLGDDVLDDDFIIDLVKGYDGNLPGAKQKFMDDDIFVNLVRRLIPYQNNVKAMPESSSQILKGCDNVDKKISAEELQPDKIIFRNIDSYFNTSNSYDSYLKLTKKKLESTPFTPNIDGTLLTEPLQPDQSLRAYRKYFCRRCLIYNCQLHKEIKDGTEEPNVPKYVFPKLERSSEPCSKTCYRCVVGTHQGNENVADVAELSGNRIDELSGNRIDELSGNRIEELSVNRIEELAVNPVEESAGSLMTEKMESSSDKNHIDEIYGNPIDELSANRIDDLFVNPIEELAGSLIEQKTGNSNDDETFPNPIDELSGYSDEEISKNSIEAISPNTIGATAEITNSENEWTFSDQTLLLALVRVIPNDCCAIARTMIKSCEQVYPRMKAIESNVDQDQPEPDIKKKKGPQRSNISRDHVLHLHKNYTPCDHPGRCDENTACTCLNCEKFCSCDTDCRKRVRKCTCKGSCLTHKCICSDGQRECDMELCACISCKNVGIQQGLEKKLQVVASPIHGWGVAIKENCERYEFIAEYRGELISPKEANNRGKVYDKNNLSYMFHLNDKYVVDGVNYGSKIRFVNYSKKPNCNAKVVMVNGDHRIGVYALRFIEAGEELLMDYFTYDPTKPKHT